MNRSLNDCQLEHRATMEGKAVYLNQFSAELTRACLIKSIALTSTVPKQTVPGKVTSLSGESLDTQICVSFYRSVGSFCCKPNNIKVKSKIVGIGNS